MRKSVQEFRRNIVSAIKCLLILIIIMTSPLKAQNLLTNGIYCAGNTLNNGSNYLSFTVGEAVTGSAVNGSHQLEQGQQQNFKAFTINNIQNKYGDYLQLKVWPNPVFDLIHIRFSSEVRLSMISIYDISGKLIRTEIPAKGSLFQITVSDLSTGSYLLICRDVNGQQAAIRFIKTV